MSESVHWFGALGIVLAAGCGGSVVPSGGQTSQSGPASAGSSSEPPKYGSTEASSLPDAGAVPRGDSPPTPVPPGPAPPDPGSSGGTIGGAAVDAGGQPTIIIGGTSSTTTTPPPSQASLVTLAWGHTCPWAMAIDATNVYWTDCGDPSGGYVMTVPKAGGAVVALATGDRLSGIAVNGSNVYWVAANSDSSSGMIMTVPVGGGISAAIASQSGEPSHLAADSAYVYWGELLVDEVMKAPLAGGAPTPVASAMSPFQIAIGDTAVYWMGTQGLMTAPKTGGTAVALTTGMPALPTAGLAVNATAVYFTAGPPFGSPGVSEVGLDGGAVTTVAQSPPTAPGGALAGGGPIALDATRVYWADMSGSVYAAPLNGGTAVLLATGQDNVASIAVDETAVYWLVNGNGAPGGVVKLALLAVDWP
jgi:hypothetical protein